MAMKSLVLRTARHLPLRAVQGFLAEFTLSVAKVLEMTAAQGFDFLLSRRF